MKSSPCVRCMVCNLIIVCAWMVKVTTTKVQSQPNPNHYPCCVALSGAHADMKPMDQISCSAHLIPALTPPQTQHVPAACGLHDRVSAHAALGRQEAMAGARHDNQCALPLHRCHPALCPSPATASEAVSARRRYSHHPHRIRTPFCFPRRSHQHQRHRPHVQRTLSSCSIQRVRTDVCFQQSDLPASPSFSIHHQRL